MRLHYELHPLVELAFVETNPGPVKWAMEQTGVLRCGAVRPPLAAPSARSRERISELLLADAGLLEREAARAMSQTAARASLGRRGGGRAAAPLHRRRVPARAGRHDLRRR